MNRKLFVSVVANAALVAVAGAQAPCDPLPPPVGEIVEVWPAQASTLRDQVAAAATGTTVVLHDGTYDLSCGDAGCRLVFQTPGVTLRSYSGNREAVILDGAYQTNELISIYASDVVIADITLMRAYDHPIHITGPAVPISGILIHNLHISDPGQQAIKINPDGSGLGVINDSTVECSNLELTDVGRTHIRDGCYTGGIDGHATTNLLVRRNRIEGFWCDDGLSEHGVHLWRASADTVVEENLVLDCARGIGFGLGYGAANGHAGGIIRNNFVAAADSGLQSSPDGFDTGITLESAAGAEVYHNTVVSTFAPLSSSIEWRWDLTTATVANNLTSHALLSRDGASATLDANISTALLQWFFDPSAGDLHLVADDLAPVDVASVLAPGLADDDFDGLERHTAPDVGADEYGYPVFIDDFELGTTSRWSTVAP
ncbi:MAG: right-handed parallel beta-helix repeat-containing protein [Acidobacteriota bacterium]